MTTRGVIANAVVPGYLLVCLLLGGSTRSIWPNLLLQIGAIAILAWTAQASSRMKSGAPSRHLMWLVVAMLVTVLLQLIPLPPGLWSAVPGREAVARGFDLLGQPRPWLPLSLAPYDTMTSALWLLPPVAVLAGILRLGAYREQWLAMAVGFAAFAGLVLGILQVTGGVLEPRWYLYAVTNTAEPVGIFANVNHMGTLLISTFPFMVALLWIRQTRSPPMRKRAGKIALLVQATVVLVLSLAVNGSLAAQGLAIPVIAASLLLGVSMGQKWARWGIGGVAALGLAVVIGIFASPLPNYLPEKGAEHNGYSRQSLFSNGLRATADVFPFGTGSGSFPSVYPAYENPDVVDRRFVNHAHNDYIELALETGLGGIMLILAFLLWWAARALAIWRAPIIDHFARASTIASGAILAHSVVDYPLRTSAIAALFAMCVALMAGPRRRVRAASPGEIGGKGARHL